MDEKLKKQFEKGPLAEGEQGQDPSGGAIQGLFGADGLDTDTDYLVCIPPGAGKTRAAIHLLLAAPARRPLWYIAPPPSLSPYRAACLKQALPDVAIAMMTTDEQESPGAGVVTWSTEMLLNLLPQADAFPRPALIIVDDAEFLALPEDGSLEILLTRLPRDTPLTLIASPLANGPDIAAWMTGFRGRPCRYLAPEIPLLPQIPAFFASNGEMVGLLDKKRLTGRVKRFLKEDTAFSLRSPAFVKTLVKQLVQEQLTPAAVQLPSGSACDLAANHCPAMGGRGGGDLFTLPLMTALLDRHPFLKTYPPLTEALSKRVASYHPGQHPLYHLFLSYAVGLGAVDMVFGTKETLGESNLRFKTLVLCLPQEERGDEPPMTITPWEMTRLKRLAGRRGVDPAGCILLAHVPGVDAAHIKDCLLPDRIRLESGLVWNSRRALGFLAGKSATLPLEDLLFSHQHPPFGDFCHQQFLEELKELLPEAACTAHILSIKGLNDLRLRLMFRLAKISGQERQAFAREKSDLEALLGLFPCETCPHANLCRKRGSRRIRGLLDEYEAMAPRFQKSDTGLKRDFFFFLEILQVFGLADAENRLTPLGQLALKTGMNLPQPLMACHRAGLLGLTSRELLFALLAGFVELPAPLPPCRQKAISPAKTPLVPVLETLTPMLWDTRRQLLRFGIMAPAFAWEQASLMWLWTQGMGVETLSKETDIQEGYLSGLISRTRYLMEVMGDTTAG